MLAKRIKQLERPSSEDLETVIEFGSAPEAFTQHLKAAKLMNHFKNPILMHYLVQQFPSCYAMLWEEYKRRAAVVDLETCCGFMEDLVEKALEATFGKFSFERSAKAKKRE